MVSLLSCGSHYRFLGYKVCSSNFVSLWALANLEVIVCCEYTRLAATREILWSLVRSIVDVWKMQWSKFLQWSNCNLETWTQLLCALDTSLHYWRSNRIIHERFQEKVRFISYIILYVVATYSLTPSPWLTCSPSAVAIKSISASLVGGDGTPYTLTYICTQEAENYHKDTKAKIDLWWA